MVYTCSCQYPGGAGSIRLSQVMSSTLNASMMPDRCLRPPHGGAYPQPEAVVTNSLFSTRKARKLNVFRLFVWLCRSIVIQWTITRKCIRGCILKIGLIVSLLSLCLSFLRVDLYLPNSFTKPFDSYSSSPKPWPLPWSAE